MSDFISKIGHLDPRFYSLIYCDTGGPDVGGPDVGGPDVRFPCGVWNIVGLVSLIDCVTLIVLCDIT